MNVSCVSAEIEIVEDAGCVSTAGDTAETMFSLVALDDGASVIVIVYIKRYRVIERQEITREAFTLVLKNGSVIDKDRMKGIGVNVFLDVSTKDSYHQHRARVIVNITSSGRIYWY